jgi:Cellulase (glycosyl hydrolase family 5)
LRAPFENGRPVRLAAVGAALLAGAATGLAAVGAAPLHRIIVTPRAEVSSLVSPGLAVQLIGRPGERSARLMLACPGRIVRATRTVRIGPGGKRRLRWRIPPAVVAHLRRGRCEVRVRWRPVRGRGPGAVARTHFVLVPGGFSVLHSTASDAFVTPSGVPVQLRSVNVVPVWASSPRRTWAASRYSAIAAKGFDAVRFTLYWDEFEPSAGVFDQTSLSTLDTAVARAKAAGLYVILDEIHLWGAGGMNDVPGWARTGDSVTTAQTNGGGYVKLLAARYRNEPAVAAYDLVNEFYRWPVDQNAVLRAYDSLISQVRTVDPAKIVLIEPTFGDTSIAGSLADFSNLTNRSNVVWSIHDDFAGGDHDGYAADGSQTGDYTWNGTTGYAHPNPGELEAHLLVHVQKMALVGLPIWIGEFGIGADAANHDRWINDQVALFDKYHLGRNWWEYHTSGPMSATNSDYTWKPWVNLLVSR